MSWKGEYTEGWTHVRGSCINFTEKTDCKFLSILYTNDDFKYEFVDYEFNDDDKTPFFDRYNGAVTVYRAGTPEEAATELQTPLTVINDSFIFENTNCDEEGIATYISFSDKNIVLKIIQELKNVQKIADENGKELTWV